MKEKLVDFSRRVFVKSTLGTLLALSCLPALAQLQVDILGVGSNQIPIAIEPFTNEGSCPEQISSIIGEDLKRSGAFRVVSAPETAPGSTPDWNQLLSLGVQADVSGEITRTSDGRYLIHFALYDTARKQTLDEGSYTAPEADLRLTAHKIADRIYEKITGEKGVFASRIAFVRQEGRHSFQIVVADSDGHNPQVALRTKEPIISISWAPDGKHIAYVSFENKKPTVFVQNINTGRRTQVAAFRGNNSAPAFSPDGQTLAVALTKDGPTQIYLMNADGGNVRRFTESSGIDTEPVFSPDGHYIYFTSDRGGGPQIYRKPVAGGAAQRVSFGSSYAISPTVSPKNNQIAYIVRNNGNFQLVQQDLETGAVVPLSQTGRNESPSYAPNGNMIIFATDVGGKGVLSTVSTDGATRTRLSLNGDIREPAWGPTAR